MEKNQDIQTRLKDTSEDCLNAFIVWESKKQDSKAQEDLQSAIHELRKVSSRLEIELAVSERDQMTAKPIPIPSHRSHTKGADSTPILEGKSDVGDKGGPVIQSKPKKRRGGGGGGAGGNRKRAEG